MVRPAYAAVEPRVACNPLVPAAGRYERIAKGGRAVTKGMFSRVSQRLNRRASRTLVLKTTILTTVIFKLALGNKIHSAFLLCGKSWGKLLFFLFFCKGLFHLPLPLL